MTEHDLSPAEPAADSRPARCLILDLSADADRLAQAFDVVELASTASVIVLRVLDQAGAWIRLQVGQEDRTTWSAA